MTEQMKNIRNTILSVALKKVLTNDAFQLLSVQVQFIVNGWINVAQDLILKFKENI